MDMKYLSITKIAIVAALVTLLLASCEEEYTPPALDVDQQIVVEGYVEAGENASPTFVLLTRSLPYIGELSLAQFEDLFVKDASVVVNDGDKDVSLTQLCLNDLPEDIKEQAAAALGINIDSTTANICAYVDLFDNVTREVGRSYTLTVEVDDKMLTASTTIPRYVGLTDFRWDDPPGEPSDSIARLWTTIDDPAGPDYYRYLTGDDETGLIAPFQSVTDDAFFDGQMFEFPINKAEPRDQDFDPNTFGFYTRGDSITIKWCTIDRKHFDFWNTRDFSANSGGPFSSYTRISSNVEGGLGIFGGYACETYDLYCPPK